MKIIQSGLELRAWRKSIPREETIGFVPTMGALHEGHLSLVRASRDKCSQTVASIFVNPLQFGPNEDFSRYPRPLEKDIHLLSQEKADILFMPAPQEVYPNNISTFVIEESVSLPLCGAIRPGHFRGVTTIVLKLFNLVQPDFSFFGQKDAQQCAVIERMVRDLNVATKIIRCPIVREADGLALSSRNAYLSPSDREKAPLIYQSLQAAERAFRQGEKSVAHLTSMGRAILESEPAFKIQYWDVRHPSTLETLESLQEIGPGGALCAVAAILGTTRLIDNWVLGGLA